MAKVAPAKKLAAAPKKKEFDADSLMSRLAKLEAHVAKMESDSGLNSSEEEAEPDPEDGTDPSVEPVTKGDPADEFEDSEKTDLENPAAEDDAPDPEPAEDEPALPEKKKSAAMSRVIPAKPTRADLISLAAKFGFKLSPAGGGEGPAKAKAKTFSQLVEAKTVELGGAGKEHEAMTFCLKNHKAEYAEYRKSFVSTTATKTL